MTCVRCGDPKQMHCKADGSNVRNALCGKFLERWSDDALGTVEEAVAPVFESAHASIDADVTLEQPTDHSEK